MTRVDEIRSAIAGLKKELREVINAEALSQWNKDNSPASIEVSLSGKIHITGWITTEQLRSAENFLSGLEFG